MHGDWVVDHAGYSARRQLLLNSVAHGYADGVLVEHVLAVCPGFRPLDTSDGLQQSVVASCLGTTSLIPLVKVPEFNPQDCRLDFIETAVPPLFLAEVFLETSVGPKRTKPLRGFLGISNHHAGVAARAQILAGEKTKTSHVPQRSRLSAF